MKAFKLIILSAIISSCGLNQASQENTSSSGKYESEGQTLQYSSQYVAGGDIEIKLVLEKKKEIQILLSPYTGLKEINGSGHQLDHQEIKLLKDSLSTLQDIPDTPTKDALLLMTEYISEVPLGHPIGSQTYNLSKSVDSNGIQCLRLNEASSLALDEGDNESCHGRCGSGCGEGSSWTQDCLELDTCIQAAQGSKDQRLCGKAWQKSADDWAMGKSLGCNI